MKRIHSGLAVVFAGMLAFGPALADKGGKGHDKGEHGDKGERAERGDRDDRQQRPHFEERHRVAVNNYYAGQFDAGRNCPPGLAKKHNGCMPPGQAKKWHMGQALPAGVRYYTVPQSVLTQFGPPPAGYQYVRVDSDILLLGTATRVVIDAILNLGRA
jgi:Ni/Co efflux regulator RcnB